MEVFVGLFIATLGWGPGWMSDFGLGFTVGLFSRIATTSLFFRARSGCSKGCGLRLVLTYICMHALA